jgi:hypothetical protein
MGFDAKGLNDYIDVAQRIADFREQYPHGSLQPADPAKPWEQAVVNGIDKTGKPFACTMIVVTAAAYRTPDDTRPGIGMAWEVFPGRTPYTLGSELMNAETSAWGRAIVAVLASDSKRGIASREEVRNRQAERDDGQAAEQAYRAQRNAPPETRPDGSATEAEQARMSRGREPGVTRHHAPDPDDPWAGQPAGELPGDALDATAGPAEERPGSISQAQMRAIHMLARQRGVTGDAEIRELCAGFLGRPVPSRGQLSHRDAALIIAELGKVPVPSGA